MGKALINSHIGAGKYSITYYKNIDYATGRIAELDQLRADIEIEIYGPGGWVDQRDETESLYNNATDALNVASAAWIVCAAEKCQEESTYYADVMYWTEIRSGYAQTLSYINQQIAALKAKALSALSEIGFLATTADEAEVRDAWCTDLWRPDKTPIPAGTAVGTIETYSAKLAPDGGWMPDAYINVVSAYQQEYAYDAAVHYCVKPLSCMDTADAINNYLQFLYVMANNPAYAVGKLASKNESNNTAVVELFGAHPSKSIPSGFPFTSDDSVYLTLTGIPVEYMNCGAKAFEVNDWVVVQFGGVNRADPKVIGFAESPRKCKHLLDYTCQTGGSIEGQTPQFVDDGEDGQAVSVVLTDAGKGFVKWSDDRTDFPTRQDVDVTADVIVTALLSSVTWPTTGGGFVYDDSGITFDTVSDAVPGARLCCDVSDFMTVYYQSYTWPAYSGGDYNPLMPYGTTYANFYPGSSGFEISGTNSISVYEGSGGGGVADAYVYTLDGWVFFSGTVQEGSIGGCVGFPSTPSVSGYLNVTPDPQHFYDACPATIILKHTATGAMRIYYKEPYSTYSGSTVDYIKTPP